MTARQLTFALNVNELCNFDNFHSGSNLELVARLQGLARGQTGGLWLWGEQGVGRSHLLQALCQATEEAGRRALYLPLASMAAVPEVLESFRADVIAIDDLESWLPDRELEIALMTLCLKQLEADGCLVVAGAVLARRQSFALPDLASRLRAFGSYEVRALDDTGLRLVLGQAARKMGLELTDAVAEFWLSRGRRQLSSLLGELERLDGAAMAEQRRLTIPLLKDVLGF